MARRKSQQGSEGTGIEEKKKEGFVKSPRALEHELFGPSSPIPDRWRVFNFIKYRIQDNKRVAESESISREYIISQTGICPNHFARIIKSLEKDKMIQVKKGNYRDSCSTYWLHKERFKDSVIVPDVKSGAKPHVDNSSANVDKPATSVDNLASEMNSNTKMVSSKQSKHQNGVSHHQNGVESIASIINSLGEFPSRSLVLEPLNQSPRALEGQKIEESFTLSGDKPKRDNQKQIDWLNATNGTVPFEEWEKIC